MPLGAIESVPSPVVGVLVISGMRELKSMNSPFHIFSLMCELTDDPNGSVVVVRPKPHGLSKKPVLGATDSLFMLTVSD